MAENDFFIHSFLMRKKVLDIHKTLCYNIKAIELSDVVRDIRQLFHKQKRIGVAN